MDYFHFARTLPRSIVAGEPDKIQIQRQIKLANEVSHEQKGTFEDTDE